MKNTINKITAFVLAAMTFTIVQSPLAQASDYKVGDLVIAHPVARATVPGQKVGGGYLQITNNGTEADILVGGSAVFSGTVEIHEMKMENDVMKMNALPNGLRIEPGQTVELKPGSFHIMFMKLTEPLAEGEKRKTTLVFEKAGSVTVTFNVKSIAETMKMKHADHMKKKDDE